MNKPSCANFIKAIWEPHPRDCWLILAAKKANRWLDVPIRNDKERNRQIREFLRRFPSKQYDLYFCPNPFRTPKRQTTEALRTPYAWCDIDEANPASFKPPPGVMWSSSPGRYQGLWRFTRTLSPSRAEDVSRHLAYEHGGDPNGWSVTKVLRIPGTYNHKRDGKPPKVKLLAFDLSPIKPTQLLRSSPRRRQSPKSEQEMSFNIEREPNTVYRRHRRQIRHAKASALLRHRRVMLPDRSAQIFTMMKGLFEANVPWDDIACLIWHSPYFRSKHGADPNALKAEIQRAMSKFDQGERA